MKYHYLSPDKILEITSKIQYSQLSDEEHKVRTPKELLAGKPGTCYDVVELERKLFADYNFKTYFSYEGLPVTDNRTHTFLVFESNGKFFGLKALGHKSVVFMDHLNLSMKLLNLSHIN